jgi:hypothetical protein
MVDLTDEVETQESKIKFQEYLQSQNDIVDNNEMYVFICIQFY